MRGVVYEMEHAIAGAQKLISEQGLSNRGEAICGDILELVPSGANAYVMKHIIHDWDDERSITILRNCKIAMAPGGRLMVVENVLTGPTDPDFAKFGDLEMLIVTPGGRERTADEYSSLYARAGFRLTRIVPTTSTVSIIEGVAA